MKDKSWKDGNFSSESEFSDEMMAIRRDFVTIHGEMVLLKNYSSLNFAGTILTSKYFNPISQKTISTVSKVIASLNNTIMPIIIYKMSFKIEVVKWMVQVGWVTIKMGNLTSYGKNTFSLNHCFSYIVNESSYSNVIREIMLSENETFFSNKQFRRFHAL